MKEKKKPLAPFALMHRVAIVADTEEGEKTFHLTTRTIGQKALKKYNKKVTAGEPDKATTDKTRRRLHKLDRRIARLAVRRDDMATLMDSIRRSKGDELSDGDHDELAALARHRYDDGETLAALEEQYEEVKEEYEGMFPKLTDEERAKKERDNAIDFYHLLIADDPDGLEEFVNDHDLSWIEIVGYIQARIEEEKGNASAG